MKKAFLVEDENIINNILEDVEYGTLSLCANNKPYSLPLNFVQIKDEIFFHGSKSGKKIDLIKQNQNASFSVVESLSLLPSYFSTSKGNACPATQFFKSIIIDGKVEIIEDYKEKEIVLEALMKKLQKEGKYIPLNNEMYKKAINATGVFKLKVEQKTCKVKVGQNFTKDRYERVKKHLLQRATKKDLQTLKLIEEFKKQGV